MKELLLAAHLGFVLYFTDIVSKSFLALSHSYQALCLILIANGLLSILAVIKNGTYSFNRAKLRVLSWVAYVGAIILGYGLQLMLDIKYIVSGMVIMICVAEALSAITIIEDVFDLQIIPNKVKVMLDDLKNKNKK